MIAAQSRFQNLCFGEAVSQALDLFRAAERSVDIVNYQNRSTALIWEQIPSPSRFPSSLKEFYRLVVKCKSHKESELRYKEYLMRTIHKYGTIFRPKYFSYGFQSPRSIAHPAIS